MCDEKKMKAFQFSVRMRPPPKGFRFYFFQTKIRGTSAEVLQRSPLKFESESRTRFNQSDLIASSLCFFAFFKNDFFESSSIARAFASRAAASAARCLRRISAIAATRSSAAGSRRRHVQNEGVHAGITAFDRWGQTGLRQAEAVRVADSWSP